MGSPTGPVPMARLGVPQCITQRYILQALAVLFFRSAPIRTGTGAFSSPNLTHPDGKANPPGGDEGWLGCMVR